MDVLQAIRERRTIRQFQPQPVEEEKLARILEAATWAPNHRLTEPWRFYVLTGKALAAFGEAMSADLRARGEGEDVIAKFKADLIPSPLTVAVTSRRSDSPLKTREDYAATCAGIQNMLLAAHALGLGGYWRTGRLPGDEKARRFLKLPDDEEIAGFVYLGYPDEAPEAERTPWRDKVVWLR